MPIRRRDFLTLGAAAAGVAAAGSAIAQPAEPAPEQCFAMMDDSTHCIGCRGCQRACRKRANLPPVADTSGFHEQPGRLSSRCLTLVKAYRSEDGAKHSFVKKQCMHCLDPACVASCPVNALERISTGAIIWHEERCFGCRYCQIACPFDIPKVEHEKLVPAIRKCDFCSDLIANGQSPECVAACPTGALMWGPREKLLAEAHSRLHKDPKRYVNHVYGEREFGGTAALYLAAVPFDKLGFPVSTIDTPLPELTRGFLGWVPMVIIGGAGLLTGARWMAGRRAEVDDQDGGEPDGEEEKS